MSQGVTHLLGEGTLEPGLLGLQVAPQGAEVAVCLQLCPWEMPQMGLQSAQKDEGIWLPLDVIVLHNNQPQNLSVLRTVNVCCSLYLG